MRYLNAGLLKAIGFTALLSAFVFPIYANDNEGSSSTSNEDDCQETELVSVSSSIKSDLIADNNFNPFSLNDDPVCIENSDDIYVRSNVDFIDEKFNAGVELAKGFKFTKELIANSNDGFVSYAKLDFSEILDPDKDLPVKDRVNSPLMQAYRAGLRMAFNVRDYSHQAVGAHLVGMHEENFEILEAFAISTLYSPIARRYAVWEIVPFQWTDENGVTKKGERRGWIGVLPGAYDLIVTGWNLFRWTNDDRYLSADDEPIGKYYHDTLSKEHFLKGRFNGLNLSDGSTLENEFIANTIASIGELGTYHEFSGNFLGQSGDAVALQYQAHKSYANILRHRSHIEEQSTDADDGAEEGSATAEVDPISTIIATHDAWASAIRRKFIDSWWNADGEHFICGYAREQNDVNSLFDRLLIFNRECNIFPLTFLDLDLEVESLRRARLHAEWLKNSIENSGGDCKGFPRIWCQETSNYIPEAYFSIGEYQEGLRSHYKKSKRTLSERTYPENVFVIVANTITRILGIDIQLNHAVQNDFVVKTRNLLPDGVSSTEEEEQLLKLNKVIAYNVPLRGMKVDVYHDRSEDIFTSAIKNHGTDSIKWQPSFIGDDLGYTVYMYDASNALVDNGTSHHALSSILVNADQTAVVVAKNQQGSAPVIDTNWQYSEKWKLVWRYNGEDIECAAYEDRDCLWGKTFSEIEFDKLNPLTCGIEHAEGFAGFDGYSGKGHWCQDLLAGLSAD